MNQKKTFTEARTLKGFHDKLPAEALVKTHMLQTLRGVFESYGFMPIETPHLEYAEILTNESEDDAQKQLYRFKDHGERDVALRFDLTVPFARFVVQHRHELTLPFKRYAIGNVFRGESPQAGRYREFTQCDFDFVGTVSTSADAEIVEVISRSLETLGIKGYLIRLNNRRIVDAFLSAIGLPDKTTAVLRIVDKLDKIGADKVAEMLKAETQVSQDQLSEIMDFIKHKQLGSFEEFFSGLATLKAKSEQLSLAILELEQLCQIISQTKIPQENIQIDFSIMRGLGYYTGIVYETVHREAPELGSICSGGRYDNLTMTFSAEKIPGVGTSFGVDRLVAVLDKLALLEKRNTPAQVLVTQMNAEACGQIHQIAEGLRELGVRAEVYPDPTKLKKQFSYANDLGHPFVLIAGPDELAKGIFALKNMKTGEQEEFRDLAQISAKILGN